MSVIHGTDDGPRGHAVCGARGTKDVSPWWSIVTCKACLAARGEPPGDRINRLVHEFLMRDIVSDGK